MATSDDDFHMSDLDDLDLLGPLMPNFDLEADILEGLESTDLNVSNEKNREVSDSDQQPTAVPEEFTADDVNTSGVFGDDTTDGVALELVNEPEKDQDLIEMMEVVEGITTEENKEKPTGRFPKLSSDDKENILDEALSKSTKKNTKYGVKIFRQWLTDREKDATFENYTVEQLNCALTEFYAEVRNTDGEYYAKSTLVGIRASINRHLRAPPFS
ncbi:uncharacterized protein LOC127714906 [Mytilus californianus]|uniref:uncharacterized protein LOC127714906 n=1 Tax=Mytilus californianus TaxID=6549 RepID=UPI002246A057|nr:uncharacterized protein LOC127714906 [Mytilus californianus]